MDVYRCSRRDEVKEPISAELISTGEYRVLDTCNFLKSCIDGHAPF